LCLSFNSINSFFAAAAAAAAKIKDEPESSFEHVDDEVAVRKSLSQPQSQSQSQSQSHPACKHFGFGTLGHNIFQTYLHCEIHFRYYRTHISRHGSHFR
jgi:hypothetical protein